MADSKSYDYVITYTNIDGLTDVETKTKGVAVFTKGQGISDYQINTVAVNQVKVKEMTDLSNVIAFLNNEYASKGQLVEIKLTLKP